MNDNLVGQQIEHYRIEEVIGIGGMGTVYRAEDINLARPVAIKIMHPSYANQSQFQERFRQEAQASARLEHPSIVRVYHFGREDSLVYMVMEFVPGLSLGSYLKELSTRKQVIRLDETLLLMAQVADALGYAHRKGVIHRDIKPDNIIVKQVDLVERPHEPPLRAVVTDFGLAKLMEGGIETKTGEFLGTLAYVSPEVVSDKPLDGRSDIYSLGVVLFQLATGQLPFRVRTPSDALRKHLHQQPPVLQDIQPGIPIPLSQIIWKAMAKSPDDRYQTGDDLAADLRSVAVSLEEDEAHALPQAVQTSTVSMVVELDSNPDLAHTSRWFGDKRISPPGYDRLLIHRQGEEPDHYSLYKRRFTIGRSQTNDIVLIGNNVSRRHALLEHISGEWLITDGGSTNGTLLNKQKLSPNDALPWPYDQEVKIGPFLLNIKPAENTPPAQREPSGGNGQADVTALEPPVDLPAVGLIQEKKSNEDIAADLRPQQLKKSGICRVLLLNNGDGQSVVTVSATAPYESIRFDSVSKQVPLAPGQKGIVDFYLEPNKRSFIGRRRMIPFRLVVSTAQKEWHNLPGEIQARPVISIWLLLAVGGFFLIFFLLLLAFIFGYLPWTPNDLLSLLNA